MDRVPYRILATFTKHDRKKPEPPTWFYYDGMRQYNRSGPRQHMFHTYGKFGGSIRASSLRVVKHPHNDSEAIAIIEQAKESAFEN